MKTLLMILIMASFVLASVSQHDLIKVSPGRGCPFKWFKCVKYCEGYMFEGGFCLKRACICIPSGYNLLRAVQEAKKKLKESFPDWDRP